MRIHQKREVWYLSEPYKDIRAFSSEEEAKIAAGWLPPVEEILDGSEEEEESSEKEASANKQAPVFRSKSSSKKEV